MKNMILILLVLSLFVACTSIPVADPSLDTKAKAFQADPEGAIVYVYRNEKLGGAVRMDVLLNNQFLGETRTGYFMWLQLPPGEYTLTSRAENSDQIDLDVEAGEVYYVRQEANMGVTYSRIKLHLVDAATGQKGINECSLLDHRQWTQEPQEE